MSSDFVVADESDLLLQEDEQVTGFLVLDQTAVETVEVEGEPSFLMLDETREELLEQTETTFLLTDVPMVMEEAPEESLEEGFVLSLGRGPQGPPGPEGPEGPPSEPDAPDWVTIFENGLL